jgi:hypothetical protein
MTWTLAGTLSDSSITVTRDEDGPRPTNPKIGDIAIGVLPRHADGKITFPDGADVFSMAWNDIGTTLPDITYSVVGSDTPQAYPPAITKAFFRDPDAFAASGRDPDADTQINGMVVDPDLTLKITRTATATGNHWTIQGIRAGVPESGGVPPAGADYSYQVVVAAEAGEAGYTVVAP